MACLGEIFPHIWFLASGGSLDFIAGVTTRAPAWMQNAGLEWLHRLTHEPKRLFRRYVVHGMPFALRLLARSSMKRWRLRKPDWELGTVEDSPKIAEELDAQMSGLQ
jgi:N-acetylglucosaminyldiphosphoundecaprenol N-acetyl-beta-D-mannosaminyltransferase